MENITKKKTGIEAILDRLLKSTRSEKLEEENVDEEEIFVSDDATEEESTEEESTEDVEEEITEDELEEEDPTEEDVEKSMTEEEIIDEDEEVEKSESPEVEISELVETIVGEVEERLLLAIDDKIASLENTILDVFGTVEKQAEVTEGVYEKSLKDLENLSKSIKAVNERLDGMPKTGVRKSVSNINITEKFKDEEKTIDDLSKSQKAEILSSALQAGNRSITIADVTNAELGYGLSNNAERIIKQAIK